MSKESKSWLYLFVLSGIWGSSFILMKRSMYTGSGDAIFTDSQVAAMRMTIAAVVLLPFGARALRKLKTLKSFLMLSIVGVCGSFFPAFLFTYAETGISSGYAGMLNSFTPIFALIIGFVIFRDRLSPIQVGGVVVGAVGVVLLMLAGKDVSLDADWSHILAIVVATFC